MSQMKLVVVGLFVIIAGYVGLKYVLPMITVQRVLNQVDEAADLTSLARRSQTESEILRGINLRMCPSDFQEAFLDYRQIAENSEVGNPSAFMLMRHAEAQEIVDKFNAGNAVIGEKLQHARIRLAAEKAADVAQKKKDDARLNLEKVALRYGAQAKPKSR
jgi:hypothetical protein